MNPNRTPQRIINHLPATTTIVKLYRVTYRKNGECSLVYTTPNPDPTATGETCSYTLLLDPVEYVDLLPYFPTPTTYANCEGATTTRTHLVRILKIDSLTV